MLESSLRGDGQTPCEHWRALSNRGRINLMPDRQNHLGVPNLARDQPIELCLSPVLLEKARADHDDAEAGLCEAAFDRLAKAVTNGQLELVDPDAQALILKESC